MKSSVKSLAFVFLTSAALAQSIPQAGLVSWWRAEGNAQDSAGTNNGTPVGGVTFQPGIVGQAFALDGTSGFICTSAAITNPQNFTLEFWFKTTTAHGGVLMGFGDSQTNISWCHDRHVYMDDSGRLHFGVYNSNVQTADSAASYNDGRWHHVAATISTDVGTSLYVDGVLAAKNPTATNAQDYTGWWRIGENNLNYWPFVPASCYFGGLIDEVAIYNRVLSSAEIQASYNAENSGTYAEATTTFPRLSFSEVHYNSKLADEEARFTLAVEAEATGESSAPLFEGEVALLPGKLPDALKIVREGNAYRLVASRSGHFRFKLEVVAKVRRDEPWNETSFVGPAATIASLTAQTDGTNTEVQLLNGTLLESVATNGVTQVNGFLGADQTVALRWQGKVAEVARKALLTADSTISAQITPVVIKYTSRFHYDVVQGHAKQLTLTLPATQTLTRLEGDQIRDWQTATEGDRQVLTVELIKPLENTYDLTLFSEQTINGSDTSVAAVLSPPQPLNVDRESGTLTLSAEDMLVEIDSLAALRQINAPDNTIAAYRFNVRPFKLALRLKSVEPVVNVADRVKARLEETRLVVTHNLTLHVEKAGIYTLELEPQAGFDVADVRGQGIEDWKVNDGRLQVSFSSRVLGQRQLEVQLEQALKIFPGQISVLPLRVSGAAKETAQIGVASAPGIRLRTAELNGLREVPANRLPNRGDEILAYTAEQPDWQLTIASEKLAARIVAEVFNLVTIGDGVVGGSATIRYSLVNQGVQEFKVRVPAQFKNVEFTGPNIRRKEQTNGVWTIGLQDKVWGGYTLVVTYDDQFDSAQRDASLPVGGIHAVDVERETGSIAVTTAANLQLSPGTVSDTLRRVDETELSPTDRSFITRAVVLAWQYTGNQYDLALAVQRFTTEPVLDAVADRTQITSVLSANGEMLTQASFMVKNNQKQFQRFQLSPDAKLWSCYVNGQPAKPEHDGDWVLVPLPRNVDRDQAFAVDIVYAQTTGVLAPRWSKMLELDAPHTDVPNTYAEWQLLVPPAFRLSDFGGTMNIAQGTTYGMLDAWEKFLAFYIQVLREAGSAILFIGFLAFLVIAMVISSVRRGWNGVITLLVVMAILMVLAVMLLPALSAAKRRAQSINSISNLRQIGIATRMFADDNGSRLPMSFGEMSNILDNDQITYDPETGQRYTYLGAGMSLDRLKPDSVLAYSPIVNDHCEVLFADGHVEQMTGEGFAQLSQRGLTQLASPEEVAGEQQRQAIAHNQFVNQTFAATALPASGSAITGGGGAPSTPPPMALPAPGISGIAPPSVAAVAGIRSLRIELPQTGQPFLFTKVLNIGDEPLSIRARIMSLQTFQTIQMVWQTVAFLIGLTIWWTQWHRINRSTLVLTVALMLILGSVCSLLVQWRALHDALIVGFPVVTLAIIAWLVWRYWPRGHKSEPPIEPPSAGTPAPMGSAPPVVATIALLLVFSLAGAHAANLELGIRQPAIGNVSIVSAIYTGAVNDRVALLNVELQFSSTIPGQTVHLFGNDVAVERFMVKTGSAELIRDGDGVAVQIKSRGAVTLNVGLLVKTAGDVTKRRLEFGIPPALSSQVELSLDEAGADVDFPSAIAFKRILDKDKTRVEAVVGSGDRIELLWTPRMKQAAEVAATVFCRNAALVTFGSGVVNTRATLDYQITQGELRQARVQLPAGQRLLRVEGREIRTWEVIKENGAQVLIVDLLKGVPSSWELVVETESAMATLPATEAVAVPHALDVKRETGLMALQGTEELALSVESMSGLERVDAEEFEQTGADKTGQLFSVFRFSSPEFALRVRAETVQPEIEAVVRNNFRVGAEQVALSTTLDYTVKRTGLFALRVKLPDGYRVESVVGDNILQQVEHNDGGARVLEVTLKDRTSGAYTLGIELTRTFKELPTSLAIAGVHPLDTAKLTGFVAVSAEPGVAVSTEMSDGLMEIPAPMLPDYSKLAASGSVLAYRFISAEPKSVPDWSLSVATEAVAAWVRADVVNTFSFTETLVSGHALVRYDIANAPVKELRIRVPDAFKNVEISGPNIRSREQVGNLWRVELQSPISGLYTLTVTWDQPRPAKSNAIEIAGVSADGVERETGLLAISAKAPLQVSELKAVGLQRVDSGDFPEWAGEPDASLALVYHYARPDYKLMLNVQRFEAATVLQALVDSVQLTSVMADDGQMMTEMSLSVRNNGRQFVEVGLPAGATVWSAFVAGQPVRPSLHDGKILLPIEQSGADDGAMTIDLTYVNTNTFPRTRGTVGFVSPKFDVPLKNARWELYLPPDYNYQDFGGTMTRETAPTPEASSKSFSLLDYSRMEQISKEQSKAEVQQDVSEARQQLASGNVREASVSYYRAKMKSPEGTETGDEVKQLEKDLQNAQASNLINAQSEFSSRNNELFEGEINAPAQPSAAGMLYDAASAQQQWAKLQQAQEVIVAQARPLHVNLPVRGVHFGFTQVLQTEPDQAMTIQMQADNTKAINWPKRILTLAGAFLALWGLVAMASHLTGRTRSA
jgi:type II secretory pathway pseudopilin PulG